MDKLKSDFFAKGGSDGEWRDILSEGLAPEDMEEFEVGFSRMSAMNHAKRVLGVGRVIEYSCYDHQWRPQRPSLRSWALMRRRIRR